MTEVGLGQLGLGQRGSELIAEDAALARAGLAILDANWLGHATRASSRLYPHQWSWDAACIAIAYSHFDQARAETELRSLFEGQWRNGLLPHIRFTDGARYFPGPEFWQTELSPDAPSHPRTSGIVQPPVHATAVWQVYRNALDIERAEAFLRELLPRLAAWHEYLYRERTRDGEGLVELWHPWESGIDNSPLWDEALARITPPDDEIPEYKRVDTEVVDSSQRPTNAEYDRYAYLVKCYRERAYDQARIRAECPFAIQDVLFNAILVAGGPRPRFDRPRRRRGSASRSSAAAATTRSSLDSKLWSEADGMYLDYDLRVGAHVPARTWGGLAPLYCGVSAERASRLLDTVHAFAVAAGRRLGRPVRGGRRSLVRPGPLLARAGLAHDQLGHPPRAAAARLRRGGAAAARSTQLGLARAGGFWEHYNAKTGEGQGTEQLSWTAAIVLDLLLARPGDTPAITRISGERS